MTITLYLSDRGLTFDDRHEPAVLLAVPDGCEVLPRSLCIVEPLLAMPDDDDQIRGLWRARDLLRAAVDGDERFVILDVYAVSGPLPVERN